MITVKIACSNGKMLIMRRTRMNQIIGFILVIALVDLFWPLPATIHDVALSWSFTVIICNIVFWTIVVINRRHRARIRNECRRWQYGLCGKCSYDLRGSGQSRRCPECGATFEIHAKPSPIAGWFRNN
jgi:hypothetical protein